MTKGSNLTHQSNTYRVNNRASSNSQTQSTLASGQTTSQISISPQIASTTHHASGTPIVTGIEKTDDELAEALKEGDSAKAQRIYMFSSPGVLTMAQKMLISNFIQENFK